MAFADLVGGAAALCTTVSFLPQAIRVIRTRDTRAISLAMYVIFTTGIVLWGVYGLMIGSWPVIVANAVTVVLSGAILAMKLRDVLRGVSADGRF